MNRRHAIASVLAAAVAVSALLSAQGPVAAPDWQAEKCYGIAKRGANDCAATGSNSCGGTSRIDGDPDRPVAADVDKMGALVLTCCDVTELVTSYLEERLPFWQRVRFRLHTGLCRDCRQYIRQVRRTIHLLGALPEESVPDEVCQNLLERDSVA
jgi:uncharacterized membrane protein